MTRHARFELFTLLAVVVGLSAARSTADESKAPAAASMLGKEAGDVRDDNGLSLKLVWCPPGAVSMEQVTRGLPANALTNSATGARGNDSVVAVNALLSSGYWLGKYEVTQGEWKEVLGTEPWERKGGVKEGDDFPAAHISWEAAMRFCRALTAWERQEGRLGKDWEYTLPTEAQWERACRARSETRFSFGDDSSKFGEYAWWADNLAGQVHAHRVGQKKPNAWGLHDMHGNIAEWCFDHYASKLPGGRDPLVRDNGTDRVIRGGGWNSAPEECRSAMRRGLFLGGASYDTGFRVALTPVRPAK